MKRIREPASASASPPGDGGRRVGDTMNKACILTLAIAASGTAACGIAKTAGRDGFIAPHEPLITHLYTADPSAHVFEDALYLYPSHDLDSPGARSKDGGEYDMKDYHVFSMKTVGGPVVDHGRVLSLEDIPWAAKQLWAPDAAYRDGTYYLYFPAKDVNGIFRIGVAASPAPSGPFAPQAEPIPGVFGIDPAVFLDGGAAYLYFGGLWGGQLEKWSGGTFDAAGLEPSPGEPALGPRVVRLAPSMLAAEGPVQEIVILDEAGMPLRAGDHERRFFEGAWVHTYRGRYYLSYSTGDTHYLAYAIGDSPTGPFTYAGRLLEPVLGWTTHHSIVRYRDVWYLFYHDSSLSGGKNHLRCVKYARIEYDDRGLMRVVK